MTPMANEAGRTRIEWIRSELEDSNLDGLVCFSPSNVLMMSGYWPVVGTSIVAANRAGDVVVLAPKDEADLAHDGWAGDVVQFSPGSLHEELDPNRAIRKPLGDLLARVGLTNGPVGYESAPLYEGSSYSATYRFHGTLPQLLNEVGSDQKWLPGDHLIQKLRFALTPYEIDKIRCGGDILGRAFQSARESIRPGAREPDGATALEGTFAKLGLSEPGVTRAGAFAWCMSGPRSGQAGGAFAMTSNRALETGDLVLVHVNPFVDGYFGDVTRTYCLGRPNEKVGRMYEAIFEAREKALAAVRPGVRAADVDRAARDVIDSHGFGQYFTHGVGHSVGFSVISAEFPPRLNPASLDILQPGCTVNIEPSIYIQGFGGIRYCDVITVTNDGYELLTDFQQTMADLVIEP